MSIRHRTDRFSRALSTERVAKMGQTIRQSMPSHANYAFMQPDACAHYSQQPQAYPPKSLTYPYTIGVLHIDLFELEVPSASFEGGKSGALRIRLCVASAGALDVEHNMILGPPPASL